MSIVIQKVAMEAKIATEHESSKDHKAEVETSSEHRS